MAIRIILILCLIELLSGCASASFTRPDPQFLKLGQTTHQDILAHMGEPTNRFSQTKRENTVRALYYYYSSDRGDPVDPGIIPARAMTFYFVDNLLVGHLFYSSFKEDHSKFNEDLVGQIEEGKTSQRDVLELFGKPVGILVYPLIDDEKGRELTYFYEQTGRTSGIRSLKFLRVRINSRGIVSGIESFPSDDDR